MDSLTNLAVVAPPKEEPLTAVWGLRVVSGLLEVGLWVVVAGSVVAFGSVHTWAYVPLWYAILALFALAGVRAAIVVRLRRSLGRRSFRLDPLGRSLLYNEPSPYGMRSWSFDLDRPLVPVGPLLLPGVFFAAWVVFQLVPMPSGVSRLLHLGVPPETSGPGWQPLSMAASDTLRGLLFLGAALLLHAVGSVVFDRPDPNRRFRLLVAWLGLALALGALAQAASGTRLIYGLFLPSERDGSHSIFGPFVNRNHFAGYMLMVVPVAFGVLARAFHRYAGRVGARANLRRRLVELQSAEGTALIYASIPALAAVGALIAANSRGALLAFGGVLLLGGAISRGRRGLAGWFLAVVVVGVVASWWGIERFGTRLSRSTVEAGGRTAVWRDSLERMDGLWVVGSGFNTFGPAMSRVGVWQLPDGATPWPEWFDPSGGARFGFRTPVGVEGMPWYREAHNDYLQLLVEAGLPGLFLGLWAIVAVWRGSRDDPWLLAALIGVLLHSLVDFPLQIPAVTVLFVVLAAAGPVLHRSARTRTEGVGAVGAVQ